MNSNEYENATNFLRVVGDGYMDYNWKVKSVQLHLVRNGRTTDLYKTFQLAQNEYIFKDHELAFLLAISNPQVGAELFGPVVNDFTVLTDEARVLAGILYIERVLKDQHDVPVWMLPQYMCEGAFNSAGKIMTSREYVNKLIAIFVDGADEYFVG